MSTKSDNTKVNRIYPEVTIPANCCSNGIITDEIPSPVGCLPNDELKELKKKIAIANEFLLNLALSEQEEEDEKERFYEIFKKINKKFVKIKIESKNIKEGSKTNRKNMPYSREISGLLDVVGRDFIVIKSVKYNIIIPYRKIIYIELEKNHHNNPLHTIEMDPKLRRALVMNFGEVVTKIPQLILQFFNVTLIYFLQNFHINNTRIKINGRFFEGKFLRVKSGKIILKNKRRIFRINISDIDFMIYE